MHVAEKRKGPAAETRPYNSERRARQAVQTRRQMQDAAARLFARHGYSAVSVEDVAREAGVAPATVYAAGGKRELLAQIIDDVVTVGTGRPVGADPDGPELRDLDDPDAVIRLHVANVRALKGRGARAHSVLWRAAASDSQAAAIWRAFLQRVRRGQLDLTRRLHELGALRPDLDPETAADVVLSIMRPEAYDALVVERGWSLERWCAYLEDTLRRLLLA
jgi:AcrR family transcriptional regulator